MITIATITWMNGAGDMEQKGRKERHPHDGLRVLARLIVRKLATEGTNEDRMREDAIHTTQPGPTAEDERGTLSAQSCSQLNKSGNYESNNGEADS